MTVAHAAEPVAVRTVLHRARPEVKLVALLGFVLAVALVRLKATWPYAIDAAVVLTIAAWARVEAGFVARRLVLEVPFVAFVILLPVFAEADGWWAAWGIVAKATLAVVASAVLAGTTTAPELLVGLQRLRVPPPLVAIGGFAVRYVQVIMDALARVQVARTARGDDPRWLWQARAVGQSFGGLALRCLQRGERVHGAMLARGYDGTMPDTTLLLLPARSTTPTTALIGSAAGGATGGSGGPTDDARSTGEDAPPRPAVAWTVAALVVLLAVAANLAERLA